MSFLNWISDTFGNRKQNKGNQRSPIERAEFQLGLKLSAEYVSLYSKFPKEYRYATILGISSKHESYDIVALTKYVRKIYKFVPSNLYVVASLGIDDFYMLQDTDGAIYECHSSSGVRKAFDSLAKYIEYLEANNFPIMRK